MLRSFTEQGPQLEPLNVQLQAHSASVWPLDFDDEYLNFYLHGFSAKACAEAILQLLRERQQAPPVAGAAPADPALPARNESFNADADPLDWVVDPTSASDVALLLQEVVDQYRIFHHLENLFRNPPMFLAQVGLPIPVQERNLLLRRYYELDKEVVKHFFGTKLSKAEVESAVDLHPYWNETYIHRQTDNMRSVCRTITGAYHGRVGLSMSKVVTLQDAIFTHFALPEDLSMVYQSIVFGFEHRLSSRVVVQLPLGAICSLCYAMVSWCDPSQLFLSTEFLEAIGRLKSVLCESRVVNDLYVAVLGEAPVRKWGLSFDETPPPSSAAAKKFSKKMFVEFPVLLRTLGRLANIMWGQKDLSAFFDTTFEKIIVPFALTAGSSRLHTADSSSNLPSSGVVPPSSPASSLECSKTARELSAVLGLLSAKFSDIPSIADHRALDTHAKSFFDVIRLFVQLTMANTQALASGSMP